MTQQNIIAIYDTPAHAELAVQDLLAAGVPDSAIERHAQEGTFGGTSSTMTTRPPEHEGFWASIFGGEHDHDATVYDRSMQGGSTVVSVKVGEDHVHTVSDILEKHDPIDIDERASSYGLTQTTTERMPLAAAPDTGAALDTTDEGGKLQLSEESLAVGKRVINHGTTRIRRFVVETPVEEQVTLHDERVTLERRPVTDGRAVPTGAFTDKSIEMTETAEEAVVSKTARVVEEIDLRKTATDRVETVRDTVRREDVEVVKVPGDETLRTTQKPAV